MKSGSRATWSRRIGKCGANGARAIPPSLSRSAGRSGPVARDARFVDRVDLFGIEEHLGVAPVDLPAHEDVEQIRVDVVVELHAAQDLERLRQRLAFLVRP